MEDLYDEDDSYAEDISRTPTQRRGSVIRRPSFLRSPSHTGRTTTRQQDKKPADTEQVTAKVLAMFQQLQDQLNRQSQGACKTAKRHRV